MNKVILLGNVTADPDVTTVGEHKTTLCTFSVAVNEVTKAGKKTHFVNCKAWGKTGETIGKYFTKGKPILLEGSLNQETWEKDGRKNSKLVVSVYKFDFVDYDKNVGNQSNAGVEDEF